jgi:hypothetical protein
MLKLYADTCFMKGNVISDHQFSSFIRPRQNRECNGFIRDEGVLQRFDLNNLPAYFGPVKHIAVSYADRLAESVILYCFRHFNGPSGNRHPVIKGFLLTDRQYRHLWHRLTLSPGATSVMAAALEKLSTFPQLPPRQPPAAPASSISKRKRTGSKAVENGEEE